MQSLTLDIWAIIFLVCIIIASIIFIARCWKGKKPEPKAKPEIKKHRRRVSRPDYNTSKSERE